ncbi:DUF1269 domain-containing protein [Novosphingobium sp.]|uniref:DUF1269 domain-containing protein n=1 Tax=Novosphingobium sp. TaxID=1874826 RepID=UPI0038BAC985
MQNPHSVVAVFADHAAAETAVKTLALGGIDIKQLSVIGKGYHVDEQVVGFYNQGDRVRFWGTRGAFWGGLWSLFFGGLVLTLPAVGPVMALGYIAASIIAVVEGALVVGTVSAVAAALYGIGIPKDSVLEYETAIHADRFVVMAHGTVAQVALARKLLETTDAEKVDVHTGTATAQTASIEASLEAARAAG